MTQEDIAVVTIAHTQRQQRLCKELRELRE